MTLGYSRHELRKANLTSQSRPISRVAAFALSRPAFAQLTGGLRWPGVGR